MGSCERAETTNGAARKCSLLPSGWQEQGSKCGGDRWQRQRPKMAVWEGSGRQSNLLVSRRVQGRPTQSPHSRATKSVASTRGG